MLSSIMLMNLCGVLTAAMLIFLVLVKRGEHYIKV